MPPLRNDIRNDIRNDNQTACPICAAPFTPIRRQQYCSPACRQAAWRTRHPTTTPPPTTATDPRTQRRDTTVYQCPECDTRYFARQWCDDCNRPCLRLDHGGLCPHCSQPVTISDLTDQHPIHTTKP